EAQPPMMMPYTPSEEIAKMYSTPTLMSAITHRAFTGMTAQAESESTHVTKSANRNTPLLATAGVTGSFRKNLSKSANDGSRPQGPTTFGPSLICTAAQIFLWA